MAKRRVQRRDASRRTTDGNRRPRRVFWGAVVVAAMGLTSAVLWHQTSGATPKGGERAEAAAAPAQFVGSTACASCHPSETAGWRSSQHHDAMGEASGHTVLGNFRGATFTYAGTTSTFFKRNDGFYVRTDGSDG